MIGRMASILQLQYMADFVILMWSHHIWPPLIYDDAADDIAYTPLYWIYFEEKQAKNTPLQGKNAVQRGVYVT